jgi:hypothetical protein
VSLFADELTEDFFNRLSLLREPHLSKNGGSAVWKRIASDCTRNAPFLLLDYRDARTIMGQTAKRITTNNTLPDDGRKGWSVPIGKNK